MAATVTTQPALMADPTMGTPDDLDALKHSTVHRPTFKAIKEKLTTRDGWLGSYDFYGLCMPQLPFRLPGRGPRKPRPTPFYALEDDLPILIAMVCGFQHSLAMLAGLITPPIIFASALRLDPAYQNYMVAASLINAGILSVLQMTRWRIPFTNYYYGTGLITVVGTSFSTISTAFSIFNVMYDNGTCPSTTVDGVTTRGPCPEAFGYLLGTSALCSLTLMGLAFVKPKALKKLLPPIVTGGVILLIGASLIGHSGILNWAGGANDCHLRPETGIFQLCPTIFAPRPLPWGSAEFLGLGFLTYATIIFLEFFGSPFMRNASIIVGLAVGMIVAGACGYVSGASITSAPPITFLWVKTFPLKLYAPAIIPFMIVYIALGCEVIGDVTASSEASRQPVSGLLYDSRVQGGLLADGFNGLLSALFTVTPMSIFAQNNGVIVLTRCANRAAGYWCAGWLILFGVLAKISGVFLAIPNPVLGGVTTFLFATVMTSGLRVLSFNKWTRRDRFIMASGFSLGIGVLLAPDFASYMFTYSGPNQALRGFMDAIVICIQTPFLIFAIVSVILNLLLPKDPDAVVEEVAKPAPIVDHDLDEHTKNGDVEAQVVRSGSGSFDDKKHG